ncbi:MAG: electron transport complex subunit RsxA [Clostridia bacterium]|nr:electron transport complex subunit RsxA [Clostridia bacterium]
MVDAGRLFSILITTLLVENFVLVKFLGCCPFLGVSKKTDTAIAMGMAVTFVMALASAMSWLVNEYILIPFGLEYLQTIAFILVIAALVQIVEMAIMKLSPPLYASLGIYLPLITTNCAVLGVALLNVQKNYGFLESLVSGIAAALSFTLAIWLFAGVRERLEHSKIPSFMKGMPIALVSAGLIAMAFLGFSGMKL